MNIKDTPEMKHLANPRHAFALGLGSCIGVVGFTTSGRKPCRKHVLLQGPEAGAMRH